MSTGEAEPLSSWGGGAPVQLRGWGWSLCPAGGAEPLWAYLTSSEGLMGLAAGSRGTGEVASIRAGLRMIGRDMGATPTCRGDARGCRMRGDWLEGGEPWLGGPGLVGLEQGRGGDESDPGTDRNHRRVSETSDRQIRQTDRQVRETDQTNRQVTVSWGLLGGLGSAGALLLYWEGNWRGLL